MKILDYFYTEKEAAAILRVNRITIWRWMKKGKLDKQQVGREILIPKWQVDILKTMGESK